MIKVGDRVKVVRHPLKKYMGMEGVVIGIYNAKGSFPVLVKLESGSGQVSRGLEPFFHVQELELVQEGKDAQA